MTTHKLQSVPHHYRRLLVSLGILALFLVLMTPTLGTDFSLLRNSMVREIESDVRFTRQQLGKEALDERVLQVLRKVPRHEFVPEDYHPNAYENRPLPIGFGQTISQPYIVAIMTDLLSVKPTDSVFELGTGSGYQAAILAELGVHVYTMEIIAELGERAKATLQRLGYRSVAVRVGDGYYGWQEHAPFDAIVVTAAGDHIPLPLIHQLKPGGRMVIPIGSRFFTQQLMLIEKQEDGTIRSREILPVSFVPITGKHAGG